MKLIGILLALSAFIAGPAHAQYTCNDRVYLQSVLEQLNATCESGAICTAVSAKGSNVERAVEACVKNGFSESSCNSQVTCTGNTPICTAVNAKGSTVERAVEACVKNGFSETSCNSQVTCR